MPTAFPSTLYYQTLGLDPPFLAVHSSRTQRPSDADIKIAYRNALLRAHPDKNREDAQNVGGHKGSDGVSRPTAPTKQGAGYTVDDVLEAYRVLSVKASRDEYDRYLSSASNSLTTNGATTGGGGVEGNDKKRDDFILGLEVLDLGEDFEEVIASNGGDEEELEWVRACRCGEDRGFRIKEEELEDAVQSGAGNEVVVGCVGCSLWVRVGFGVEEDGG
ncbi:hypothetical protein BU24DRAFT_190756 [Aaosphaeria arxii CBS 175.79]|uniref:Diphthamide biosynthesis protein 4 n=1 Tax=Aaosphaeria arxii CBS 175.79 TaxID=1450172 RepID=A0A6A5XRX3_9PLEO|nr:uncharacterized protein BU24DRAFT_190756 [Aaosphaeria arxii CBS 175.79]KAF2016038.1 hypothetical protein BU24DRAFT_190756 [Aaosphaeria arxii CBS 175.79]